MLNKEVEDSKLVLITNDTDNLLSFAYFIRLLVIDKYSQLLSSTVSERIFNETDRRNDFCLTEN
jgi:hypothetical protein